jgi:hypothetical protein
MILVKVGAPVWLSFIVVAWGCCAMAFAAMKTEAEFYALRFLLGLTECGTFPGMVRMRHSLHGALRVRDGLAQPGCSLSGVCAAVVLHEPVLLREGHWHGVLLDQRGDSAVTGIFTPFHNASHICMRTTAPLMDNCSL